MAGTGFKKVHTPLGGEQLNHLPCGLKLTHAFLKLDTNMKKHSYLSNLQSKDPMTIAILPKRFMK